MIDFANPHYEEPRYLSDAWYEQHRHLSGGALLVAAVENRARAEIWASGFQRLGDLHIRPHLTGDCR